MPEQTGRFQWVVKLAMAFRISATIFLALLLVATIGKIVLLFLQAAPWEQCLRWIIYAVGELVLGVWVSLAFGVISVIAAGQVDASNMSARISRIETLVADQGESTRKLLDLACLSDRAKSVAFRDREIEALRESFHSALTKQDIHATEAIIRQVERDFGYSEEAGRMKNEMLASRQATLEEKVDAAISRVSELIDRRDWPRATREAQQVIQTYPNNPKAIALPDTIEAAKNKHKRDLLQSYDEAVKKNDVDRSIELLKQLDKYLTPQEAAALEESARGVFKAKLHNLGVQFAIQVTDQQWYKAVATGEEIIREFLNSRMAYEVRQKMDLLRSRAAGGTAATRG